MEASWAAQPAAAPRRRERAVAAGSSGAAVTGQAPAAFTREGWGSPAPRSEGWRFATSQGSSGDKGSERARCPGSRLETGMPGGETSVRSSPGAMVWCWFCYLPPKLVRWDVPRPRPSPLTARSRRQALGALLLPFPLFLPPGSAARVLPILAAFTSAITTSLVFCIASLCLIMHPPHTPYECFHPLSHSVSHIHSFSHSGHIIYSSQDATVCVLYLGCFNGSFRNI